MARPLELPYDVTTGCAERYAWLEAMRPMGWPVFLDSGDPARSGGRYDILAAAPRAVTTAREDAFAAARRLIAGESASHGGWPVSGAVIGYFGYELGRAVSGLTQAKSGAAAFMPETAMALYPWTVVVDHVERRAALTSLDSFGLPEAEALRERLVASAARPLRAFSVDGPVASSLERPAYLPRARKVLDYIEAGDCYQANLTREFSAPCSGDPWTFYRHLHDTNPAPMGAYLEYPFGTVLSSSPERFLVIEGREVVTRPIKGTRRRRADPAEDAAAVAQLVASPKDRAENVMIVDLLRNDLGRVCETGSVKVRGLCELESFATVHHLVSTVTGTLRPGLDALDALEACFPGGSITGAPKRRAMQIIDELEPHRREVYCGAIGYIAPGGRLDMNIPIRTTLVAGGELRFYAGGGIVADSTPEDEFDETEVKIAAIRRAIAAFPQGPHGGERMKDKKVLRAEIIARRDALAPAERERHARNLADALAALPQYTNARSVLATMSIGSEWDTRPFLDRAHAEGKTVVLPRIAGPAPKRLRLHAVPDLNRDLKPGIWDIPEPDPERCPEVELAAVDFAWVPALAANRSGYRLGYGAGYFDKLLAGRGSRPCCVVALPTEFLLDDLPHEPHDIPVDLVITSA